MFRSDFQELCETELDADPIREFRRWFDRALSANLYQPEAMTLATCTPQGIPSARVVLLRGFDERGFLFYTNYDSRKGHELAANPRAALVILWAELHRQVRIEGSVARLPDEESDAYFRTRPLGHRLSAWASAQTEIIANREVLEKRMAEYTARFADGEVPRPPCWGGYVVVPELIEFWQGRENRLHDRIQYRRRPDGSWIRERLAP